MIMPTLKQKSINGMLWTISEYLSVQLVSLIVTIILARLLEPSQFGLIGMLAIFTAIAQSIMDSGFGSALIQKKDADNIDASSIFFFNLIIGAILAGILSLTAPLIAKFFNQPILIPITRVLSLGLIINAFSLVQTSLLTKTMDFRTQMRVGLAASIGSGVVGIIMAYLEFGVWALVGQTLSRSLIQAILLWLLNKWRPLFVISISALRSMFSFGSKLLISGLIDTFFRNIYQTFIGRAFSPEDLGFYTKAYSLESTVTQSTSAALGKVLFPAMAPLQDQQNFLKKAYRKTIRVSLFVHFPLMIGLWATADPLMRLLLTNKWAPSIPYFQILCIVGLFYPLHSLNLNILKVKGRSDLFLRLEIIKKVNTVLAIIVTFRFGIMGLLYGQLASTVIAYFLNSFFSGQLINYSQWDQIKDLFPAFITALIMGGAMFFVGWIPVKNYLPKIVIQTLTGISVYYLISLFINSSELNEVTSISKNVLGNILIKLKVVLCRNR